MTDAIPLRYAPHKFAFIPHLLCFCDLVIRQLPLAPGRLSALVLAGFQDNGEALLDDIRSERAERRALQDAGASPASCGSSLARSWRTFQHLTEAGNMNADVESEEWRRLLPAWFVPRMASDSWYFAIVMSGGYALYVESIYDVRISADDQLWIDVHLHTQKDADISHWKIKNIPLIGSPTERPQASINASHVLFAVEMADT